MRCSIICEIQIEGPPRGGLAEIRSGASIRLGLRPSLTPRNQPDHSEAARERVKILRRLAGDGSRSTAQGQFADLLRSRLHRGRPLEASGQPLVHVREAPKLTLPIRAHDSTEATFRSATVEVGPTK